MKNEQHGSAHESVSLSYKQRTLKTLFRNHVKRASASQLRYSALANLARENTSPLAKKTRESCDRLRREWVITTMTQYSYCWKVSPACVMFVFTDYVLGVNVFRAHNRKRNQ